MPEPSLPTVQYLDSECLQTKDTGSWMAQYPVCAPRLETMQWPGKNVVASSPDMSCAPWSVESGPPPQPSGLIIATMARGKSATPIFMSTPFLVAQLARRAGQLAVRSLHD